MLGKPCRTVYGDPAMDVACDAATASERPGAMRAAALSLPTLLPASPTARQARLERAVRPGIALADGGFPISGRMADAIRSAVDDLKRDPDAVGYFLDAGGAPRALGTTIQNPGYGATLRAIAAGGADAFYTGEIAQASGSPMPIATSTWPTPTSSRCPEQSGGDARQGLPAQPCRPDPPGREPRPPSRETSPERCSSLRSPPRASVPRTSRSSTLPAMSWR
jgi:hypothetical protein